MIFTNRKQAGQLLAKQLKGFTPKSSPLILALPRGGVPIAAEIQQKLGFPMDICLVRKLGAPGHQELAIGAITLNNIYTLNQDIIDSLGITENEIKHIAKIEEIELARRNNLYRKGRPAPVVEGKTVILVDDGLATGATMRAAIKAIKNMKAQEIIVAVPVSAADTYEEIKTEVDQVFCLHISSNFYSVGQFYEEFSQVTDEEVEELLRFNNE